MTMNNVFTKQRQANKSNYTQITCCISFAVFLITSFAAILFSPTVQTVLPLGGDSRKQVMMIFAIALMGCLFFSIYAAGLFFRYKSKETGVFLALGAPKTVLRKALYIEIIKILLVCISLGLVLGNLAAVGIWQLFRLFLVDTKQMHYQFSLLAVLIGLLFGIFISLCVLWMARMFMKRSNLMDILNEGRKNEKITEVTKAYGLSGIILLAVGIIMGYFVPIITGNFLNFRMPDIWSVTYLLAVVGLYRLITFVISYHERGRNPATYYKNIIPFSMMKSTGKQTVRNMLVISLLIVGALFALFYIPMNTMSGMATFKNNPVDFSFRYKLSADEVEKIDMESLAKKHDVEITSYNELIFSQLIGSGIERDWSDSGELIEDFQENYMFFYFINESAFKSATGKDITVPSGSYYLITQPDSAEGFWVKYDDLTMVTSAETDESIAVSFAGTIDCAELMAGGRNRYVISDRDFASISLGIGSNHQTKQILFNVLDRENAYPFAVELYDAFLSRIPADMAHMNTYDEHQEKIAATTGKAYTYSEPMEMKPDNPDLMNYWTYYPNFRILSEKTFFQNNAIFILLFTYVAIICLAAVGIIAYSRSITIGLNNKYLFEDLKKLGANNKYIQKCITAQLSKIFMVPTVLGSVLMNSLMLLIQVGNDRFFSKSEQTVFWINIGITLCVFVYMYIIYRKSLRKISTLVDI